MNFEEFEKYTLGRLSPEERKILEQKISKNPDLFAGVRSFQAFLAVLDRQGLHGIREKLVAIEQQLQQDDFFLSEEELDTFIMGSEEEKARVEKKINSDAHYQTMARDHQKVLDVMTVHGINHLKMKLAEAEKQLTEEGFFTKIPDQQPQENQTIRRQLNIRKFVLPIAAAIILLLGFFFFLPEPPEFPVVDYVWTQPNIEQAIGESKVAGLANANKSQLDSRATGLNLVRNRQYQEAMEFWPKHLAEWPEDDLARLYYAHSLREAGQPDPAIREFEVLYPKKDFIYADDVQFHLAICYLQVRGGCEKGVQMLEEFLTDFPVSEFRDEAQAIRTQIKECP